ncbi:aminotransferase class I/II-fold pyridoxal phosphate-dependent enzyme [Arthrobacter sp. 35W]|uniref:aminotransferase class I/II-fold pyridoxal phosphate-dependent enzyme n=1 Tax=Arthrobacter sp. 35W TaxID=1132441 RepID=UPI000419B552|nr:aminotransferase class I/II-fold pyridoxal phosphate-dependent enzyme [Arthrobacter sp. 35W]
MGATTEWLEGRERVRIQRGLVREDTVRVDTVRDGKSPLLDLASNDYLGLSTDPRLAAAAIAAIHRHGTGARASRVVTGTSAVHHELEQELCTLTGAESALAFSSGYAANLGLLGALGGPGTLMVLDEHIHASLIDAARLSRAEVATCAHSDLAALRALLAGRTQPRAVVVLESVYSVLGDAAPLAEAARLCREFDALLVVDEAHGIGVTGGGAGSVHAAGLAGRDDVVVTATLSKALGAQGGAVLGSALLRRHLVNTARTFIFDTGLAPAAAAAASEACRIIAAEPERVAAVSRNAALLAAGCGTEAAAGAVQSIRVGAPERALAIAARLQSQGLLVGCFRPPSVPDGVSRLRLTARADLSTEQVRHAAGLVSTALAEQPDADEQAAAGPGAAGAGEAA